MEEMKLSTPSAMMFLYHRKYWQPDWRSLDSLDDRSLLTSAFPFLSWCFGFLYEAVLLRYITLLCHSFRCSCACLLRVPVPDLFATSLLALQVQSGNLVSLSWAIGKVFMWLLIHKKNKSSFKISCHPIISSCHFLVSYSLLVLILI